MTRDADTRHHESEWISRVILHDDHRAFADLVRLHQSGLRQFLRRLTGNDWSRADDLAQETFWKAYRNIGGYQARGRFISWLFRIAYQLFVTEQRGGPVRVGHQPLLDDLPEASDSIESFVESRSFDQMMALLRADERAALVLHYRHELSHPEIADTLELPLGTVKSLIRRARLKLLHAHQPTVSEPPK